MKRSILLSLVFVVACATAPSIPENAYGLRVVPDLATQQRLAQADPSKELIDLASLGIATELRYATPSNFMKRTLYPDSASAWLRAPAARALADADRELRQRGLALKVYDAYRPYRVTEAMWEPIRNPDYVADPAKGSRHNRGAAVDVTIIDLTTRAELPMPTAYDDFTERAGHAFADLPADAAANRALLLDLMTRHGFAPLPSEWWHYDFNGWERFELMDVPLENLAARAR